MIADEPFVKPAFDQETDINLNPETAQSAEKYGWKVDGYNVALSEVGCWRLFYQDTNCTYLISDELVRLEKGYPLSVLKIQYDVTEYPNGSSVTTVGRRLNPMLTGKVESYNKDFFTADNEEANIQAIAWLTDPDEWTDYKNDDAEFAIGSPTVELYAASFDAAAEYENNKPDKTEERTKIGTGLDVEDNGYTESTSDDDLQQSYNYGIYNKNGNNGFWLASPSHYTGLGTSGVLYVDGMRGRITYNGVERYEYYVRPIVCIQTKVFDEFLKSGKYELIDDKVVEP